MGRVKRVNWVRKELGDKLAVAGEPAGTEPPVTGEPAFPPPAGVASPPAPDFPGTTIVDRQVIHGAYAPEAEPQGSPGYGSPEPPEAPGYGGPAPMPTPEPEPDQRLIETRQELESVRAALAAERAARVAEEARAHEERARLEEYNKREREQELERLLAGEDVEYATLDPDDVKKLVRPLYNKLSEIQEERHKALEARLEEQRRLVESQIEGSRQALENEDRARFYAALEAEIPNFRDFLKSSSYAAYLKAPFQPGFAQTNEEVLNKELQAGNVDLVVRHMKAFAQGKKNPADIAQVGATSGGAHAYAAASGKDEDSLRRERLELRRSGKISSEDYRAMKRKIRGETPRIAT
jgi:hypothetical protein